MRVYEGRLIGGRAHVTVDGEPLSPRLDLRNHSRDFQWGYEGSGPAQLALALLVDVFREQRKVGEAKAVRLYQDFKRLAVATLPQDEAWRMTEEHILDVVATIEDAR